MQLNRNSLVFRSALFAAAGCVGICVIVFVILFQWQVSNHEKRVIEETEIYLSKLSSVLLGYFYGQGNWVYLEERQRALDETPNVLYSYIVDHRGIIEVGIKGTESPDIGKRKQDWEPENHDTYDLATLESEKGGRYEFVAGDQLAALYPDKLTPSSRVVVATTPFRCFEYVGVCGYVRVGIHFGSLKTYLGGLRTALIVCGALLTLLIAGLVYGLLSLNLRPIRALSEKMLELANQNTEIKNNPLQIASRNEPEETRFFKESLEKFTDAFQHASHVESELKLTRSLSDLARQVAHDIRSPLAALEMVTSSLQTVPEEKRILLRSAIARIRDIANNLLSWQRANKGTIPTVAALADSTGNEVYLLASLVDILISEKRMQYRAKIGVSIEVALGASAYGLFVKVDPTEFKRVLSNVINNAVEAIDERGAVSIGVRSDGGWIVVEVRDSGKGIPVEVIPLITEKAFSHDKQGGSGLGLYHAKECLKEWGGSISVQSAIGKGTTVSMRLPKAAPPPWFVPKIRVAANTIVVVVDDDSSVHQIWAGRFESGLVGSRVDVKHLSTPTLFGHWYRTLRDPKAHYLYLFDYEFLGMPQNGIDLIQEFGIQDDAILVTSRYEEAHVIESCTRMKIGLLPKGQAGFIPIEMV